MAFTLVGQGAAATGNNGTSLAPAFPSGIQRYDLAIVQFQNYGGATSRVPSINLTNYPGWDASYIWQNGSGPRHGFWWKMLASDSEAPPQLTLSGDGATNDTQLARITVFRPAAGNDCGLDLAASTSTNASADSVGPITGLTVNAGTLAVMTGGKANDWNGASVVNGGWSKASDTESTTGSDAGMFLHYILNHAGGATGNLTVADDGGTASNGAGCGLMVTFKEIPHLFPTGSEQSLSGPGGALTVENLYTPRTDGGGPGGAADATLQSGSPYAQLGTPAIAPTGSQQSIESGAPALLFKPLAVGSEVSEESGTPVVGTLYIIEAFGIQLSTEGKEGTAFLLLALSPSGSQQSIEDPGLSSTEYLYQPEGSDATEQDGSPIASLKFPVAGSQLSIEEGVPTLSGMAITLYPTGSQLLVQDPTGFFTEYLYGPEGKELSTQSGSAAPYYFVMLFPTGSQLTAEAGTGGFFGIVFPIGSQVGLEVGTPQVQAFSGRLFPVGGELTTEIPLAMEVFWDLIPDGSEGIGESGVAHAFVPSWLYPTGSEFTSQVSDASLRFGLEPIGGEFSIESGFPVLPGLPFVVTPEGSEFAFQGTSPLLAELVSVSGSEVSEEAGTGSIFGQYQAEGSEFGFEGGAPITSLAGIAVLPLGSEFAVEGKEGSLYWTIQALGSELSLQVGSPFLPGLAIEILILGFTLRIALDIQTSLVIKREIRKKWDL